MSSALGRQQLEIVNLSTQGLSQKWLDTPTTSGAGAPYPFVLSLSKGRFLNFRLCNGGKI